MLNLVSASFRVCTCMLLFVSSAMAESYDSIVIRISGHASGVEKNVAILLYDRLNEMSQIDIRIESELEYGTLSGSELLVYLGTTDHHGGIQHYIEQERIEPLGELAPGPEGFLLRMLNTEQPTLLAVGVDERGCLYAVGELLRQLKFNKTSVELSEQLNVRSAPAFEIRGTQYGQSHIAKQVGKVRDWTEEETQRMIMDYALAGANVFEVEPGPIYEYVKSFGLMTQGGFGANTGSHPEHPEWIASESIGRKGYMCISYPESRAFMLEKFENAVKNAPSYDFMKFHGGDGGGCECDRCDPYGLTFITLVEKMAAILHKYHPNTKVYFTNQKFDNDDDNAIFNYLNEKSQDWLWGWGYGPGSDAASWQPGHRQTHRMDLFRYPGFGPYGLYPQDILRQMPRRHKLVYYNEITHWKYAQHAYIQMYPRADRNGDLPPHWSHEIYERQPDQFLTMVYNRLTFYAWPKFYHRVFNDLMRYGVGDITHSSGHHDHYNQWIWQRMLWNPRFTVDELLNEYSTTWFGDDAAPAMAKALLLLEENMGEIPGTPLDQKDSIEDYYELVKKAGRKMPRYLLEKSWLWRMYMQKGALDQYIQLDVRQQKEVELKVESLAEKALDSDAPNPIIITALIEMSKLKETRRMARLREEAARLGNESNALYGQRNDGNFNLSHDYIGLGWLKRQLERARSATGEEQRELLWMIADYENPGEGGRYDNLGTANVAPNVVAGYPYDHGQPYVAQMLDEGNRPSQRSMHFTQNEDQGVTLEYRDLDPEASYKIRFTFVRPWFQKRYSMRMNQKSQSIFADGKIIAKEVELPLQMSDFFTFDIPKEATRDGKMVIHLERGVDVARGDRITVEQWRNSGGWGTLASEVWLIKQ